MFDAWLIDCIDNNLFVWLDRYLMKVKRFRRK